MQPPKGYSALFNFKPGMSAILTILILVSTLVGSEALLRSTWVQSRWPVPYPVGGYETAAEAFHGLDAFVAENGGVECVILGSSMATVGINPLVFEEAYQKYSGSPIKCFVFGVAVATASSMGPLTHILVDNYHPRLLIVADGPRAFSEISNKLERSFPWLPWVQYHMDHFSLQGWIEEESYLFRYLETLYPAWIFGKPEAPRYEVDKDWRSNLVDARSVQGHSPMVFFLDGAAFYASKNNTPFQRVKVNDPFTLSQADMDGFQQIIDLSRQHQFKLLFVEVPSPYAYYYDLTHAPQPTARQVFTTTIAAYARNQGVPFWVTSDMGLLPAEAFADSNHLHIRGAYDFSEWLGSQVGAAVRDGLTGPQPPAAALLDTPPLAHLALERAYLKTLGLSEATYRRYQAHLAAYHLTPPDAVILNLMPTALDRVSRQTILGFFIDWSLTVDDSNRAHFFDLMVIQDRMRQREQLSLTAGQAQALARWYAGQNPADLRAAGVDYLLATQEWNDETPPLDGHILTDPRYTLLKTWEYAPLQETYHLIQPAEE